MVKKMLDNRLKIKNLSFRANPEVYAEIQRLADEASDPMALYIRKVLIKHISDVKENARGKEAKI